MARKKLLLLLLTLSLSLSMLVPSFAEEKALTINDLRQKAIDYSPKIREIKSNESTVKEKIRKNIQNSYALANALDHYYDYIHLYNDNVRNYW